MVYVDVHIYIYMYRYREVSGLRRLHIAHSD